MQNLNHLSPAILAECADHAQAVANHAINKAAAASNQEDADHFYAVAASEQAAADRYKAALILR